MGWVFAAILAGAAVSMGLTAEDWEQALTLAMLPTAAVAACLFLAAD